MVPLLTSDATLAVVRLEVPVLVRVVTLAVARLEVPELITLVTLAVVAFTVVASTFVVLIELETDRLATVPIN